MMTQEIKNILVKLQSTQKWECYTAHPDGFILEAGRAYARFGTPYSPEVWEKAEAFNRKFFERLLDLAEQSTAKTEQEFALKAQAIIS